MSTLNETVTQFLVSGNYTHAFSKQYPFYYSPSPSLIRGISDNVLILLLPIVVYWLYSLLFHQFDTGGWKWVKKYRINSEERKASNVATETQVLWGVILQQVLQTILGVFWLSDNGNNMLDHQAKLLRISYAIQPTVCLVVGEVRANIFLPDIAYFLYWWGIPVAKLAAAMFCMDTYFYFGHRLMHVNQFLYKHIHSWHHRLYVPYAFGALYNHPVEGLLLDSLGAAIAEAITGLTTREAMLFFTISTMKSVDDHAGYKFPFDPFQILTENSADYHDIHHQPVGIKSNFSQPFFVHWDSILGTRLTRKDLETKKSRKNQSE